MINTNPIQIKEIRCTYCGRSYRIPLITDYKKAYEEQKRINHDILKLTKEYRLLGLNKELKKIMDKNCHLRIMK